MLLRPPFLLAAVRIVLVVGALTALNVAGAADQKSMDLTAVTQCFRPLDKPFSRQRDFYKEETRQCYAQRWSIPRAYYSHIQSKSGSESGTLVIKVGLPAMTPGALLPREQAIPLFTEVSIKVLWFSNFAEYVRQRRDSQQSAGLMTKTNYLFYGMRVYDTKIFPDQKYRGVYVFPDTDAQLFLEYLLQPKQKVDEPQSHSACAVTSNVDNRVYIKYRIRCSQMRDLTKINSDLVSLVRSFMVN